MPGRRPMTVSPLWLQGSILTFIVGFGFLTFSAVRIYSGPTLAGDVFLTEGTLSSSATCTRRHGPDLQLTLL